MEAMAVARGALLERSWSCGNRKDIQIGDRLFLIRQAVTPRGILGSGWASSAVYQDAHWDDKRANAGHLANYVQLRFDRLIDPDIGDILPLAVLKSGAMASVNWGTQSSGIIIEPNAARELEAAWAKHLAGTSAFDEEVAP